MPRETVKITLTGKMAQEVTQRASDCGLHPGRWVTQTLESVIADSRCRASRHGGPSPEAPTAKDRPETDD